MGILNLLFANRSVPGINNLDVYLNNNGYKGLKRALAMEPQAVIEDVKLAGLRGRGGAGVPTGGLKWNGMPKNADKPHYIICNADEGEPGTFKDRELMLKTAFSVIEGMTIAGYATYSSVGYIYIRGEYVEPAWQIRKAIDQAYAQGYLGKNILGTGFNYDLYIHLGAGSYECGEESALMSSLMGERGNPRLKFPHAPFPVVSGLWGLPTLVNNVETYAAATWILANGGEEYAKYGTEKSKGTKIMSVSGHVAKPANYEVEMGTPLLELIELAGGVVNGRLKAVIPGGSSVPILPADKLEKVTLDYEGCGANGTLLGSGGFMVFNDLTDIVLLMKRTSEFYMHESCGKCTPCREGTRWLYKILDRITSGGGQPGDIDMLLDVCSQIDGRSYCGLGDAACWPIVAAIKSFRPEFEYWIANKRSPLGDRSVPPTPHVLNPLLSLTAA